MHFFNAMNIYKACNKKNLATLLLSSLLLTACGGRHEVSSISLETDATRLIEAETDDSAGRYDLETRARVARWCRLMEEGRNYPEIIKIKKVNDMINLAEFIYDAPQWGKGDYWATPHEILETNRGDCEDFSVAKYYTLKQMGVAEYKLRLVYVKSLVPEQAHMVLAYFPTTDSDPLILDSMKLEILPATQREDLVPVYSFNGNGVWLANERVHGKFIGSADRLGLWKNLRQKMGKHGNMVAAVQTNGRGSLPVGMWRCRKIADVR